MCASFGPGSSSLRSPEPVPVSAHSGNDPLRGTSLYTMTCARLDEVAPLVWDFHYSGNIPKAPRYSFALREPGGLFGDTGSPSAAIIYGYPVNRMWPQDALELQRLVRDPSCSEQLSAFVAWSIRWLRQHTTAPFVLSYADTAHGHHGGIYQATGFAYVGATKGAKGQYYRRGDGTLIHGRAVNRLYGHARKAEIAVLQPDWEPHLPEPKHLYVRPLRQKLATLLRRFEWTALPYPKPSAARPLDESAPTDLRQVRPLRAAPNNTEMVDLCDSGRLPKGEDAPAGDEK